VVQVKCFLSKSPYILIIFIFSKRLVIIFQVCVVYNKMEIIPKIFPIISYVYTVYGHIVDTDRHNDLLGRY